MATRVDITAKQFVPLAPEIGATAIPAAATTAKVTLDRTLWTDKSSLVLVQLWVSLDGGVNYFPGGGGTSEGGALVNRRGDPVPDTIFSWSLPDVGNPNRTAKLTLLSVQQSVTLSGKLEFL